MTQFHAVFLDETGFEFGATIKAKDKAEAWSVAQNDYPESRCVQIESPEDTREREARMYERIAREMDGDFIDYGDED